MTTKEKVLQILQQNRNKAVSGETLAGECSVSRTAVWKAVNSLREKGFSIEGTTNGGYILTAESTGLSRENLIFSLTKSFSGLCTNHIEVFDQIDSTNTYTKKLLSGCGDLRTLTGELTEAGEKYNNALIISSSQTAGRGRLGRSFFSNDGIYMSVIYAPEGGITNPARITAFAAVAVCRALKNLLNLRPQVKWINDIFIDSRKVCGILTEGITNFETGRIEAAVIGLGININMSPDSVPEELKDIAGSITLDPALGVSKSQLAAQVYGELLGVLSQNPQEVMQEYRELSFLIGQTFDVHPVIGDEKSVYQARATGIDDNAGLIVQLPDGTTRTLTSGEVKLNSYNFTSV